jgi:hypothetical protein
MVKKGIDNGNKDKNINMIVMAEGYRADQMDQYEKYVEEAFIPRIL